MELKGTALIL